MCSLLVVVWAAALNAQVRVGWDRDNAPEQQNKPYVVLVGLDGFRYDYGPLIPQHRGVAMTPPWSSSGTRSRGVRHNSH